MEVGDFAQTSMLEDEDVGEGGTNLNDEPHPTIYPLQVQHEPQWLSLKQSILAKIVQLQRGWDKAKLQISEQDSLLQELFGDFKFTHHGELEGGEINPLLEDQITNNIDYRGWSLGKLLTNLPSTWDGDLEGYNAPGSWKQLMTIYKSLGMVKPKRYRLCTGTSQNSHKPVVLEPSNEDAYEGASKVKCKCIQPIDMESRISNKKLQRDCDQCCSRCSICNKKRIEIMSFDYLPFTALLTSLMRSNSFVHDFLRMWRERRNWQGLPPTENPFTINEWWDGTKVREWSNFFDSNAIYELPQICPNAKCKSAFRAFPEHLCVAELNNGWNEESQIYSFSCTYCSTLVTGPRRITKVKFFTLFVLVKFKLVFPKNHVLIYIILTLRKDA